MLIAKFSILIVRCQLYALAFASVKLSKLNYIEHSVIIIIVTRQYRHVPINVLIAYRLTG